MPVRLDSRKSLFIAASVLALLSSPINGEAAEWTAEPAIAVSREYHNNIGLSVHPQDSVFGTIVTPSFDLGLNTPVWHLGGTASVSQRRYSGASDLDQDDTALSISSLYSTERNTWQLNASRLRTSLLSSGQIGSDTGAVQAQNQSETNSVSPSWTWMYSETTQLQIQYLWSEVSYGNSQNVSLLDYRYQSATATLSNWLSERNQVFVTGGYSKFHVPFTGFESDTGNVQVGATRHFSEITSGTLQAGLRNTASITRGGNLIYDKHFLTVVNGRIVDVLSSSGAVTQDSRSQNTSSVFSGDLEKKFDNTNVRMAISRALNPSGSGGQAEEDSINLVVRRNLTDLTTVYFNSYYDKTRIVEGNIANNDRTYYSFQPGATWQLSREWSADLNYMYAHIKRDYEIESAHSNSVIVTLNYRPLKMSISR